MSDTGNIDDGYDDTYDDVVDEVGAEGNRIEGDAVSGARALAVTEYVTRNLADDPDALVARQFFVQRLRPAGMVDEMTDRQRHVDVAAFADRLAVVDRFQHREQALVTLHGAADGVEHLRPRIAWRRAPFRQRLRRRGHP